MWNKQEIEATVKEIEELWQTGVALFRNNHGPTEEGRQKMDAAIAKATASGLANYADTIRIIKNTMWRSDLDANRSNKTSGNG
jgi:hypothetical protein